jgi:hypothetical protein
MQKGPATLFLELLQELINLFLHVLCVLDTLAELTDEECPQGSLFMVVLDVHVDNMHWLARLLFSGIQIFHHLVIDSLFTSEDPRSNRSLQFWNLSIRGLILLFLSNICKMPFCV